MIALRVFLITAAVAAGTAVLQVWLKLISRTPRKGRRTGLEMEDALWWTDWVVAATFALVGSVVAAARDTTKDVPLPQAVVAVGVLFFGFSVMPYGLKMVAYDQDARIKGWWWIWAANGVASLILLSAVAAGVKIYG
ncbi:hypothetical protein GCM10010168_55880 [Actinoplanes ianthinogenes]|uniref:Integral membrane protein n=1 Tax=Actinoplanes ianthinogenes TaxID=122358 RepID=A0ABN6C8S0_9ACTN|nr:hypothetical protein [Actinoplanes ianthinogenes]BCJ41413.1 hypothetical protein Aiant_20700 [Actinoplanes ianthinogenes]GGR30298.1 hypothetical protein GCM10010168_55880 [Actinoplanes ianthinogenes]